MENHKDDILNSLKLIEDGREYSDHSRFKMTGLHRAASIAGKVVWYTLLAFSAYVIIRILI